MKLTLLDVTRDASKLDDADLMLVVDSLETMVATLHEYECWATYDVLEPIRVMYRRKAKMRGLIVDACDSGEQR